MLQPQHKHFVPSPPIPTVVFFSLFFCNFYWLHHVESSGREIRTISSGSLPPTPLRLHRAFRLLFININASLEVSVSFGNHSCSASDSADSLTRVEIMWKKQIVEQINKDTQCWSMWPQQCCIQPVAKQHSALCLEMWVCKHQSWISRRLNQSPCSIVYVCVCIHIHKNCIQK